MSKGKPKIYNIGVSCASCRAFLFDYAKEGGGHLVKCYTSNVTKDQTRGEKKCPSCGQEFARDYEIHGRPAWKIIQGKVTIKGHVKT